MARSPTYSETVLADQPSAYWRMTSASTVTDTSGHLTVGTAFTCTSVAGLLQGDTDTALSFNGATSQVIISNATVINGSSAFTLEAWVKPSVTTGTQTLLWQPTRHSISLINGQLSRSAWTTGTVASTTTFGPTISVGSVYHIVYAIDAYSEFGCVNGGTYDFHVTPVNPPPFLAPTSGFTVGYFPSQAFKGTIDEVAVYNYKLSEQQAFSHYIAGADSTPSASTVVVEIAFLGNATEDYYQQVVDDLPDLYYRLNETSGTSFANYISLTVGSTVVPSLTAFGTFTLNQTSPLANDSGDHAVAWGGTANSYASETTFLDTGLYASGFALECWIKKASAPAGQTWLAGFSGGAQLILETGSTGKAVANFWNGAIFVSSVKSLANVCDGAYHHLVMSYAGGSNSTVSLYVDGVLNAATAGLGTPTAANNGFFVAGVTTQQNYGGTIDECAFYAAPLSADRIGAHYGARNNQRPLVWTDISTYVRGYSVSGGRQHELDRYEAATLNLTVNNDDRRFEPEFTTSPYYPNVLPYRRIRVWESKDGVRFPIFAGWIERWPQAWVSQSYHSEVEIQAVDGFDLLNSAVIDATDLFTPGVTTQSTDGFVVAFLTGGGFWDETEYPIVRTFNSGIQSISSTETSSSVLSIVQAYETTENGEFYIDRFGRPTFVLRDGRVGDPVLATFGDVTTETPYRNITPSLDRDRIVNDVRVTRSGGTEQQAIDYSSLVSYGRRGLSVSTLNTTDGAALTTAQSILAGHKDPSRRFESIDMLYADGGNNALLVQLLSRGIGDRIKVRRRPDRTAPSSVMEEECLISHVSITRSPKQMAVTWQLIPAP